MVDKNYLGETYTVKALFRDEDGRPFDPDTHDVVLIDRRKQVWLRTTTPTRVGSASYKWKFIIPLNSPAGMWTVWWTSTYEGDVVKERHQFKVNPPPLT